MLFYIRSGNEMESEKNDRMVVLSSSISKPKEFTYNSKELELVNSISACNERPQTLIGMSEKRFDGFWQTFA